MQPRRLLPRADWYFARSFLSCCGLCCAALLALVIVADLFQRADEFLFFARESDMSTGMLLYIIFQYYASQAPSLVVQHMLPLVMLLAGVITVTAASASNEYTVLRSSGVSMQRALLPILVPALLLGYTVQWGRDCFLPYLLRKGHEIASAVRPRGARPIGLVRRVGDEIQSISMGHFDPQGFAHNLRIEKRDLVSFLRGSEAFEVYVARRAALQPRSPIDIPAGDERQSRWKPDAGAQHRIFGRWRRSPPDDWIEPIPTWVTPAMLERQVLGEAVMTWEDLELLAGDELDVRLEMWRRRSEPWAAVVLLLLGLSVVLRRALRGAEPSYMQNVITAILLCAGYYMLRTGIFTLGESETLSPLLAVSLPVLLLAIPGVGFYHQLEH